MRIELFGHPLNPRALGNPPYVQERQILFRIALTRALYDQMAPQLRPFYVPGKLNFSSLVFVLIVSAFLKSGKHLPEERKTPIGAIHIVYLLGPTQTSFSFPLAGTPEATSWEQGQMARPHMGPSRLYGDTCEKMRKLRDGPGVRDPRKARKSRFLGRRPTGDLAPICPDNMVSFNARKTEIQPCSLNIFIFYAKTKSNKT